MHVIWIYMQVVYSFFFKKTEEKKLDWSGFNGSSAMLDHNER